MTPLLFLAEARGATEAEFDSTLIGASGIELLRMSHEAGILTLDEVDEALIDRYYQTSSGRHIMSIWDKHPEVARTNVFNIHPPRNDLNYFLGPKATALPGYPALRVTKSKHLSPGGSFVQSRWAPELERLGDEILAHDPNIIVALGNCALWALTGLTGVKALRGTTMESNLVVGGYKLLPTYHPAYILRNYDDRPVVIADLAKAALQRAYPELRRPEREIWIEPNLEDIQHFISTYIRGCSLLSVDIETFGNRITCIGFSPHCGLALVIPFDDDRADNRHYWPDKQTELNAWLLVKDILEDPNIPKLFQNGAYDIAFLWRSMKIRVLGAEHDTLLLHHSLQPEALKRLDFLGSIYSDESAWKAEFRMKRNQSRTIKRDS